MESQLRKTVIKIKQGKQLYFNKINKFNRFGCKAIFYDPSYSANTSNSNYINNNLYDVTVLSKSLLQLNSISQAIFENIKHYQNINSHIVCPIISYMQIGDMLYIVSQAEEYKLSDLIQRREGLTQFQVIYFTLDLIQLINYIKTRNLYYQIIDIQEIYLNKNMKISMPFSIWISYTGTNKVKSPFALRHQDKKSLIAPQFMSSSTTDIFVDQVNSWNTGVFIYELIQGIKPHFKTQNGQINWTRQVSSDTVQLIQKLLRKKSHQRLKFPFILLQSLFKKYPALPHMLPLTIFSCPPSNQFISQYFHKFQKKTQQKTVHASKVLNIQTAHFLPTPDGEQIFNKQNNQGLSLQSLNSFTLKNFKSSKYIKPSDRSLTQSKCYITQYADISHMYGYGYQMSTGLICFVFNDGTQMFFENSLKKTVKYVNQKRVVSQHGYQKLAQQSQMKKKLFILEAYAKSIKKFKSNNNTYGKIVLVSQYYKTNSAGVFLLSNQSIQVVFNDKIIFILTKHSIHVQNKSSDKFQSYQSFQQNLDLSTRKKYAIAMAQKLFHWDTIQLIRINAKTEQVSFQPVKAMQTLGINHQSNSEGQSNERITRNSYY